MAALVGACAAGQHRCCLLDKRREGLEKPIRAQTVAGAMGCLPRNPILPAFAGAVDNCRRLIVRQAESPSLGRGDLLEIHAVRDQDGIPVMQQRKFNGIPLDVFAGRFPVAADLVGINRRLVPVHVQDRVFQAGRAGGGHGFADPPGGHATLPFDDMDARRSAAVIIHGAEGQPQRGRHADPGRAGGQAQERGGRRRVAVEGLDPVFQEERGARQGIAPETEQVLQPELVLFVRGQKFGAADAHHLVAQGPQGVKAEGFVARGIRDDVGIRAVGVGDVIVQAVENDPGYKASGGYRSAGMPGRRNVIEQHGAQGPVHQVKLFKMWYGLIRRLFRFLLP